jgi:hypothetical protein
MREDVIARQVGAMKEARLDAIVSCPQRGEGADRILL